MRGCYSAKCHVISPGSAAPAAQPLRPQAPVHAARACGLPAASSAGHPLARLGAVPGCGPTLARGSAVVGGKSRLIFLRNLHLRLDTPHPCAVICPDGIAQRPPQMARPSLTPVGYATL